MDLWDFAAMMINETVMMAVDGDKAKADEVKLAFVLRYVLPEEQELVKEIQKNDPQRFDRLLAKIGEEYVVEFQDYLKSL